MGGLRIAEGGLGLHLVGFPTSNGTQKKKYSRGGG